MIRSRADYLRYLECDRIALGRAPRTLGVRLRNVIAPDYIWDFQRLLRRLEYWQNSSGPFARLMHLLVWIRFRRTSLRLGFTIPANVFGPGLAIVHYGLIVVNKRARVGANCRIHPGTSIGASAGADEAPQVGDKVYLAPGAKIFGNVRIASNTAIGANAVVTKSFPEEHTMIAGVPARVIKPIDIRTIIRHLQ